MKMTRFKVGDKLVKIAGWNGGAVTVMDAKEIHAAGMHCQTLVVRHSGKIEGFYVNPSEYKLAE